MKAFFVTLFFFSFLVSKGQQQNNIPDSTFTGKIVTDKTHHTRIYLTNFQQTLDTSGVYTTTYIFGAKISRPTFDINISMKFDTPLLQDGPIGFQYGPNGVGRYSGSGALRNNNLYIFLQGQMTSSNHHFYIKIKSKEKVHPVITGLDGELNF